MQYYKYLKLDYRDRYSSIIRLPIDALKLEYRENSGNPIFCIEVRKGKAYDEVGIALLENRSLITSREWDKNSRKLIEFFIKEFQKFEKEVIPDPSHPDCYLLSSDWILSKFAKKIKEKA